MVDGEKSPDNYKILKISIGAIRKNLEFLEFVPRHLKNKEMCQNIVKMLPFVVRYVSDRYKTQEMFVPYYYKN